MTQSTTPTWWPWSIGLCLLFLCTDVFAQVSTLEPISVNATRVEKNLQDIPAAVSRIGPDEIQLGSEQLGLDESLDRVPGLFLLNRYNFAQDVRASIRGFGARSSFGIRGIKIIVDGIPETLPDGQGSVDGIDIGSAEQISVIRGPASSLYGNASGGVILVESERGPEEPFTELRSTGGEYGLRKHQLKFGGQASAVNYMVNLSDTRIGGYRDHSEAENRQLNARLEAAISQDTTWVASLHHTDQPIANDPGGINADSVAADRTAARDQNIQYDAGEALEQTRLGLTLRTRLADGHSVQARVHNVSRDFSNRLPIKGGGAVSFDRDYRGAGIHYIREGSLAGRSNRLLVGLDYDVQDDDRSRFDNLEGVLGERTLEQNEKVTSLGVFLQNEWQVTERAEVILGVRYDEVTFDVTDRFLSNGDDSGKVTLDHVSPRLATSIAVTENVRFFANISSAFETPTTTEFANPSGGGFNQALKPQESTNYEIGLKALSGRHRYEASVFTIDVKDELIQYQLDDQPGRNFYENVGQSTRNGLELAYAGKIGRGAEFSAAWTWSDFRFERFSNVDGDRFDGNRIPGIPQHFLHLELSWFADNGFYVIWDANLAGSLFADNANEDKVDSYQVTNLRLGRDWLYDGWEVSPFLGVNNLLDEEYNSNIRINAFGKRYYEPAPERNFYAGIAVRRYFGR